MFQTKVSEKIKTHFIFFFFFNSVVYEITWKNIVQPGRPQQTTWCMRVALWIPKATNTQSEYVILIDYPLQQWVHERASVLRCTQTTFFFLFSNFFPVFNITFVLKM